MKVGKMSKVKNVISSFQTWSKRAPAGEARSTDVYAGRLIDWRDAIELRSVVALLVALFLTLFEVAYGAHWLLSIVFGIVVLIALRSWEAIKLYERRAPLEGVAMSFMRVDELAQRLKERVLDHDGKESVSDEDLTSRAHKEGAFSRLVESLVKRLTGVRVEN